MKKRKYKIMLLGFFLMFLGIYLSIPDGKLRLIFCDVGQGDGALIIKGNWQMLIDVGADNGKMERCLDRYIPFWDKTIEGVMISHWDDDHSGALAKIMNNYKIEHLFESIESGEGIEQKIYTEKMRAGDVLKYGKIYFDVLYPRENGETGNESSLVVVLNYLDKRFMFTGDVDSQGEGEMMGWWNSRIDGLKVSHHGSDSGSSEDWLRRIAPGVAVISVGKNSYGHPKGSVLGKFDSLGTRVYRTDERGDVIFCWK